jgi:hypothetical protein
MAAFDPELKSYCARSTQPDSRPCTMRVLWPAGRIIMTPTKLQEHIRLTYFSLRVGLGVLALVFPVLLVSYGYFIERIPVQDSMSAYYFAFVPADSPLRVFPTRGFFVGILWAIGCFLILYRGFSNTENWLLNFAGLSAIAVAFFPMQAPCTNCASVDYSGLHYSCAVALFIFLAFVAWFCNEDSLRELEKEQTRKKKELNKDLGKLELQPDHFRWLYRLLSALMIFAPTGAVGMTYFAGIYDWRTLVVEWAGIWVFSAYWLVKSYELSLSRADEKAAMGEMRATEPAAKVYESMHQASKSIRTGLSSKIASLRK